MSGTTNCYNETPPSFSGNSHVPDTLNTMNFKNLELNGEAKHSDSFLPNNNVCDNIVSSVCAKEDVCAGGSDMRTDFYAGDSSEMDIGKESDNCSANPSEDTNSLNDGGSTTDSQPSNATDPHPFDPYKMEDDDLDDDTDDKRDVESPADVVLPPHNNGAVRRNAAKRSGRPSGPGRGRPKKGHVAMYQSQISGDKNAIKIRIKKSGFTSQIPQTKKKSGRRKKHKPNSDTDTSDYERSRGAKRSRNNVATPMVGDNDVSSTQQDVADADREQSPWADRMPRALLERIFQFACMQDGCLPTLVRLSKVSRLWRDVSQTPVLWKKADLNYVREKDRTDLRLHWLILNRLSQCQDLNFGEWKVRDIQAVLEALSEHCPKLKGLNLSGWKGLNADNLKYITTECKNLERLDLSSINSTSAINAVPLVALSQAMNNRLTHLVLAHNKIAGFTQIISSIADHCPNLQLLDISNIRTFAHNTALLHVEKLQIGCPKLRVLRITNSQIWLAPASLPQQMASPGFPMLEELSLAGSEDKITTSRSMDDDGIERLLKNSTKLRLLDVRGCSKLTDSGLVRVPAWDLEHLFLSACYITRLQNSGLELIIQKWSHSLLEVDLAWSTATKSLDAAVMALAEKGPESKLRIINLCGSSVSLEPVKAILTKCPNLHSINLQSCRALPRGIKRLYTGSAVADLRDSLLDKPKEDVAQTDIGTPPGGDSPLQLPNQTQPE
ncbi:F-box/LRR-repeat protein 6 isoform X2 [Aethina tumida]|uniref:F-box/LRR-repeat protein 6 isoform X2 n=1 Tax=Aethina tumida TaxID=116153 RepID=UPI002147F8AB|nr:F-box/LRR-repeat protein 6 isoform X2 [Aethina tumida]